NTGAGSGANSYGLFPAIASSSWVGIKMDVNGTEGIVSFDAANDGTYEHVSSPIPLSGVAEGPGRIVVFAVINDPDNANTAITNQRAYFDNLTYTPAPATSANGWSIRSP